MDEFRDRGALVAGPQPRIHGVKTGDVLRPWQAVSAPQTRLRLQLQTDLRANAHAAHVTIYPALAASRLGLWFVPGAQT